MASRIFDSAKYFDGEEYMAFESGVQRLSGDSQTLLIDIYGAAKDSNTYKEKASCGVFFGKDSRFNRYDLLPDDIPANNQVSSR
jgi:hypothetical protein